MLNLSPMATNEKSRDPKVDSYIASLEPARGSAAGALREAIVNNLPEGFEEQMTTIPSYVVPLELYSAGYHTKKKTPLSYISFASQKGFIALYHFGIYVDADLLGWFEKEYPKHMSTKLDMGKSCIRFKKPEQTPLALIAELVGKRSVQEWIDRYERALGR